MRLVFLGSPSFAVPSLEAVWRAGHDVALVVTQPDRPAGRGRGLTAPPVADVAREHGLAVWQTSTVKGDAAEARLRAVGADGMALAAFAALIPSNVLRLTRYGVLNVHPSLLPRWRGAAPIQSALLTGDQVTGVSIIRLVEALDAGPILLQQTVPIAPEDDFLTLEPRLAQLGANLLVRTLDALAEDSIAEHAQNEAEAIYSRRIERDDGRIDWSRSAEHIWNQIRAYRGWPQAFTTWDGKLLKVLRATPAQEAADRPGFVQSVDGWPVAGTASSGLRLDEVVLEGKRRQSGAELLRGYPRLVGSHLS
jgi:methionyl-tRNA formyltransferase